MAPEMAALRLPSTSCGLYSTCRFDCEPNASNALASDCAGMLNCTCWAWTMADSGIRALRPSAAGAA
ncbi:hypothetical protein D3C76_1676050 [compost metagenome]